jgi:hypothetical protein
MVESKLRARTCVRNATLLRVRTRVKNMIPDWIPDRILNPRVRTRVKNMIPDWIPDRILNPIWLEIIQTSGYKENIMSPF